MQPRTLYALLAATLLVPFGTVAAQEPAATTHDVSPEITYKLAIMPAEQWAPPGATATYKVVLEGREETRIRLALRAPEGVHATLSADEVAVAPGSPGRLALTVAPPANATGSFTVAVEATSASGETHSARATLIVREKPAPSSDKPAYVRPCDAATSEPAAANACPHPKPTTAPMPERRPDLAIYEKRADALERRLEALLARIERQLGALERYHERPAEKPMPVRPIEKDNVPDVRITLSDANITIGEDRRRVALLLENDGDREGRVPIHLRLESAAGWRVELEQEKVHLGPHDRAWIWIVFHPGDTPSVDYSVSVGEKTVHGVANAPQASVA